MPGRVDFEFRFTPQPQVEERDARSGPMRMLVLADFSGRANRGVLAHADLADRPLVRVDVDNLDEVLARYGPRLHLPLGRGGEATAVDFRSVDDFHPDSLYGRVEVFRAFREMRERVRDPRVAAEETERIRALTTTPAAEAGPAEEPDSGTLERLLGRRPADRPVARARPVPGGFDVQGFIRRVVQPYVVRETAPGQDHLIGAVDQATGEQMRNLLHHRDFQTLEATWRQVRDLVSSLETGESLQIHLLDVTKDELGADLVGGDRSGDASRLHRLLVDEGPGTAGGQPWSLIVGSWVFGHSVEDVTLLAALGAVARGAGGPFLAQGGSEVLGAGSLAETPDPAGWRADDPQGAQRWLALRRRPEARWIGLALPRVLVRLPFGEKTEEIETFAFEEQQPLPDHEAYLWGNPAFACARLIGQAFLERGWSMEPGDYLDIEDLPAHTYVEAGESRLQACAEVYLSERAAQAILDRGLMPFVSYRDRAAARLLRFQSLAEPPAALAGAWG